MLSRDAAHGFRNVAPAWNSDFDWLVSTMFDQSTIRMGRSSVKQLIAVYYFCFMPNYACFYIAGIIGVEFWFSLGGSYLVTPRGSGGIPPGKFLKLRALK